MAEAWVREGPKLCMQAGMQVGESTKGQKIWGVGSSKQIGRTRKPLC